MKRFELMQFSNPAALAEVAALAWLDEVEKFERAGRRYCVALSGGRITREFFLAIVKSARNRGTTFKHTHLFWADERCVPPDDSESNYRIALENLIEPLSLSMAQVHRVRGELEPGLAAALANEELLQYSQLAGGAAVLDLVLLGLGEDAHVASLFPDRDQALLDGPYCVIENSPKPPPTRVSLTYEAIAAARKVWMLASGQGKQRALHDSISNLRTTPFGRVLQSRSDTRIFTDVNL